MEKIYHFFGTLFYIIWTIIGIVLIVGAVAVFILVKNTDFGKIKNDMMSGIGGDNKDGSKGESGGPSQQQIDCAKKILGDARVNQLMQNNQDPTEEEKSRLQPCFGSQ